MNVHCDKFSYKAFGLQFESEIELPELIKNKGKANVKVAIGEVPKNIKNPVIKNKHYQTSQNEFLFIISKVASFYIGYGKIIIIEPKEDSDIKAIRTYLLGTAFGMLLIQRGIVPIHGSAINIDGKGVIITGKCGAGKSTLCQGLRKLNYKYLSDDISCVTVNENGVPIVHFSFPQQRLCRDTAEKMGFDITKLNRACSEDEKFLVSDNKDDFLMESIPLTAIIEISIDENTEVKLIPLDGAKKLPEFINNIYCFLLVQEIGIAPDYFNKLIRIVNKILIYRLTRPKGKFTVNDQVNLIENINPVRNTI